MFSKTRQTMLQFSLLVGACFLLFSIRVSAQNQPDEQTEILSLSFEELMNVKLKSGGKGLFIAEGLQKPLPLIKYGLLVPLTEFPLYSTELIAAADIAAKYINQNGGIDGKSLMIIRGDEVADTDLAVKLAKKMVDQYAVDALIGPIESMRALRVAKEVAIPERTLMMTTTASTNLISDLEDENLVYRLIATNKVLATGITQYLQSINQHQKIIVVGDKSLYSKELERNIRDNLEPSRNSVVSNVELSRLVDYSELALKEKISALEKLNAQTILLILGRKQAADFLVQINEYWQGDVPMIIAFDGIKPVVLEKVNLNKIDQCISMMVTESGNVNHQIFTEISKLINQQSSIYDAAYVYDSVMLFAFAHSIAAMKNISPVKALTMLTGNGKSISMKDYSNLKTLLKEYSTFSYYGASGRIHFDQNGDNLAATLTFRSLIENNKKQSGCRR